MPRGAKRARRPWSLFDVVAGIPVEFFAVPLIVVIRVLPEFLAIESANAGHCGGILVDAFLPHCREFDGNDPLALSGTTGEVLRPVVLGVFVIIPALRRTLCTCNEFLFAPSDAGGQDRGRFTRFAPRLRLLLG